MLDIKLFRETPEVIKESEKKRFKDTKNVDLVIKYDAEWRDAAQGIQDLRQKINQLGEKVSKLKKEKKPAKKEIEEMSKISARVKELETKSEELIKQRDEIRYKVGNILHKDVPVSKTEDGNVTVRTWGKIPKFNFDIKAHADLVIDLDLAEIERASKLVGARFYFLKNEAVMLNFAMLRLALDIMLKHKFTPFWTPYMLKKEYMKGAAELGDFEQQLYAIKDEDLFLIATSEQMLASLHADEVIPETELPKPYTAYSACFRREAGSHGKDTKGIFRVHQFDKIEQFVLCAPKDSWDWHEKMVKISEEVFQALEIPYRVVLIASGEMNDNGSKKYDIEGWFPSQNTYRELGSATNCLDYQARKLNIKIGKYGGEKEVLHTLNNTALATERAICAIIENHQQKDGSVKLPKALVPYMNGITELKPKKK
jgi:seryl-tRNA synthetase